MNKEENFCAQYKFYTGIHDWSLSCTNPAEEMLLGCCGVLVYEDTHACKNFIAKQ